MDQQAINKGINNGSTMDQQVSPKPGVEALGSRSRDVVEAFRTSLACQETLPALRVQVSRHCQPFLKLVSSLLEQVLPVPAGMQEQPCMPGTTLPVPGGMQDQPCMTTGSFGFREHCQPFLKAISCLLEQVLPVPGGSRTSLACLEFFSPSAVCFEQDPALHV